jgi:mRNA-degrading endonuclease toxin of MazEF toxin-antitoxin module
MTKRGDVVIARFPYAGGTGAKVRPTVVVQCDRLNNQLHNTLLAMVTGNTRLVRIQNLLTVASGLFGTRSG